MKIRNLTSNYLDEKKSIGQIESQIDEMIDNEFFLKENQIAECYLKRNSEDMKVLNQLPSIEEIWEIHHNKPSFTQETKKEWINYITTQKLKTIPHIIENSNYWKY